MLVKEGLIEEMTLLKGSAAKRNLESESLIIAASDSPVTVTERGTITPPALTVPIMISSISMLFSIRTLTLSPLRNPPFDKSIGHSIDRFIKLAPRAPLLPADNRNLSGTPLGMARYRVGDGYIRRFKILHIPLTLNPRLIHWTIRRPKQKGAFSSIN